MAVKRLSEKALNKIMAGQTTEAAWYKVKDIRNFIDKEK